MMQANVLLVASTGFLFGAFFASFFSMPQFLFLGLFTFLPAVILIFWRYKYIRLTSLALLFVGVGFIRFYSASPILSQNETDVTLLPTRFEATIVETPDVRIDKTFLVVEADEIYNILYTIRVSTDNFTRHSYGERILIAGEVAYPENFEGFNYVGYLAKEGIGYVMYDPYIESLGEYSQGPRSFLSSIKTKLRDGLEYSLLPPHSSLYSAMILGDKGALTSSEKEMLAMAGLSHVVAISGMHIMILMFILLYVALTLGSPRSYAIYLALALIALYIIMIGAPASAVRAGLMGGALLLSERFGRPNSSWRALLLAGALMIIFNPLLIRYDIGFQLSFLAVLGIILFAKRIEYLLWKFPAILIPFHVTRDRKMWDALALGKAFGIRSLLAVTLSAQVLTFPLILYYFGRVSPFSPISNLLVLPLLPPSLIAGFAASLAGTTSYPFAYILSAPAWLLSSYLWGVVSLFN